MRKSISASIRISEISDRLRELDAIETRSTEQESEAAALTEELPKTTLAWRTETKSEEEALLHPRDFDVLPEVRERRGYRTKTGLAEFFAAAAGGREVVGAAADYAAACGVSALSRIPLAIFTDGQPETRAISVGPAVEGAVEPAVPYIFQRSAAQALGIQFPTHGPGTVQVPRVTAAPPADTLAKDAAAPVTAAVIALDTKDPKRISGQFETRIEDLAVYPELENVLGESIRGALSNELDNEVFNGVAAGLNGLFLQAADVAISGAKETYATGIGRFAALVDGQNAYSLADLRCVVGPSTYAVYMGLISDGVPLADYLETKLGAFRVSNRMPALASHGQKGIVTLNGGPSPIRIYVYSALEIVRDPFSGAGAGKVTLTATALVSEIYVPHGVSQVKEIHPKLTS